MNEAYDLDDLSEEMKDTNNKASSRIWLNIKIKENMLIQKYILKWLNDGDLNNKYFHRVMKKGGEGTTLVLLPLATVLSRKWWRLRKR